MSARARLWWVGLLCLGALGCAHAAPPDSEESWQPTLVNEEDLPQSARALERWNGGWIARTHEGLLMRVELEAGTVRPLRVAGLDSILHVADSPSGPAWVLGRAGERLVLLRGRGMVFEEQPLPPTLSPFSQGWELASDGDSLVLIDSTHERFHFLHAGVWREQDSSFPRPTRDAAYWDIADAHLLLRGSTLYVGFDEGEWGGDLFAWSLTRGEWTEACIQEGLRIPVVALAVGAGDIVWAAGGLAHLGLRDGVLWRLDGRGCTVVTDTRRKDWGEVPWTLTPTSFEGLAVDASGAPHVLTSQLGVVGLRDQTWSEETPQWELHTRSFSYRTPLYISMFYPSMLDLQGDTALIGGNAGVLLWKLGQPGPPRRLKVPRSSTDPSRPQ